MNLVLGSQVLLLSQLTGNPSQYVALALVTAVWPDINTGNSDPEVAPVLCDLVAFPYGRAPSVVGAVRVYVNRTDGGNDTIDMRGFAFLNDDTVSGTVPVEIKPPVMRVV